MTKFIMLVGADKNSKERNPRSGVRLKQHRTVFGESKTLEG
jgi:hypothetical protein